MTPGKFITVEGIEGVGKSTNIAFLVRLLEDRGLEVISTREPGGTPLAERIRELLLSHSEETLDDTAELLLFFAARSLHVRNHIKPALKRGCWVVCDRFTDASRAYQGAARGQGRERVDTLAAWVHGDLTPDLTVLLDAPAAVGMERAGRRGAADRLETEQLAFFERARQTYLELAKAEPGRFAVIDAQQTVADVQRDIACAVDALISNNNKLEK